MRIRIQMRWLEGTALAKDFLQGETKIQVLRAHHHVAPGERLPSSVLVIRQNDAFELLGGPICRRAVPGDRRLRNESIE